MRSREPFVEAGRMELVLAGLASKTRKAMVSCVYDTVTNWAFLHTFKLLVKIGLPYPYCFRQGSILFSKQEI